ncbi:MAG: hypothetical protein ACPG4U_12015, partial [Pseudomonadales bacterium]
QQSQDQQSQSQQGQEQQAVDAESAETLSAQERQKLQQQLAERQGEAMAQRNGDAQRADTEGTRTEVAEPAVDETLQKWLGQLPDDASRLIRNKFNYEYQKKRLEYQQGTWQPNEEQRW